MRTTEVFALAALLIFATPPSALARAGEDAEVSQPTEVGSVEAARAEPPSAPAPRPAPPPGLLEFLDQLPMLDEYGDVLDAELDRLGPGKPPVGPEPQPESGVR